MAKREKKQSPNGSPEQLSAEDALFPIRGYVYLNLILWGFCLIMILLIRWWLKDIQGVIFFFMLLAIGFALVSVYDAVFDRLELRSGATQSGGTPDVNSSQEN